MMNWFWPYAVELPWQSGGIPHDPAIERCVIHINTTFLQYLLEIAIGNGITEIKEHGM
jgi:hypothetical protein